MNKIKLPIRFKLASAYLVLMLLLVLMSYYALQVQKRVYVDEIGKSSVLLAEELIKRMDHRIFDLSTQLQIYTDSSIFQEVLSVSNIRYYQVQNVKRHLEEKDLEWRSVDRNIVTPAMQRLLSSELSQQLRELFISSPGKYYGYTLIDGIIVTNRFGGVVAITSKSADYDQSDEEWWQRARDEGIYLGQMSYDQSALNYEVDLAVRIDDSYGKFAGVLLAGLDVKDIIRSAEVNFRKFDTTQIQISTSPGKLIYSTRPHRFLDDINTEYYFQQVKKNTGSFIVGEGNQKRIYSSSTAAGVGFFKGFDWIIIISHQLSEALKPYSRLQSQVITVFVILTLACVFLIYKLDQMVRVPLNSLSEGISRLSQGDLDHKVEVESNDEFGEVASVFNSMLEKRKESVDLLKKSEEKYRGLFDGALDMIHIIDKDGVIIDANPKELEVMGYAREEFVGKKLRDIIHPDSMDVAEKNLQQIFRGKPVYLFETALISRYGEKIDVELNSTPHFENGVVVSGRTMMRDIRPRRKAEEEKAAMEMQLRQAQKMEAIGILAGGIAHDFNNILAVIIGYTELAIATSAKDSPLMNNLEKIQSASYRAKSLVYQILSFSRNSKIECIPRKLQPIIEEVLTMLRSSIPTTISIESELSPKCGLVLADTTHIHQILMNLCTNANHAMEQTGGVLRIDLRSTFIKEGDSRLQPKGIAGKYVEVVVSDTGAGIEPEVLERIFDPFFTTKEHGKGTGMGLSIIHGIVAESGGMINVRSVVGEGTEFHIYLPDLGDEKFHIEDIREEIPRGHGEVLFVDDEKMLADMGKEMLERLGYNVTVEYRAEDALLTFKKDPEKFDVIVTDQTMPEMTGTELARQILKIRPELPIVLCTGYSSLVNKESAHKMGIQAFALKPLTMKGIANILHQKIGVE